MNYNARCYGEAKYIIRIFCRPEVLKQILLTIYSNVNMCAYNLPYVLYNYEYKVIIQTLNIILSFIYD